MPTVCLKVTDEVRALWVEAASKELITLSEWLRRAADLKLGRAPEVFSAEEAKTVITEIDGGGHGTSKQVLQEGGPSEARLVPSPGEVAAEAAKKLMALAAGEEAEAGITTSQPEGVGHISQDAEGPTAQPSSPPAASASEELGEVWTASNRTPSGQPASPSNTKLGVEDGAVGASSDSAPPGETREVDADDTSPTDSLGGHEPSAPVSTAETEEAGLPEPPTDAGVGTGSPASPHSEPSASVSEKLAEARAALSKDFRPDFKGEKPKKKRR